jgi:Uma2 family endonuclease
VTTAAGLMTVEEFRRIPEPCDGTYLELHDGEVAHLSLPKLGHQIRQKKIASLLEAIAGNRGVVFVEFGFRALPEYDARRADVAFISEGRYQKAIADNEFFGAPDLIVEALSPSNTAAGMDDKERLCFANGCVEFWQVNERNRTIRVMRAGEPVRWYSAGESIELHLFGSESIAVGQVFS